MALFNKRMKKDYLYLILDVLLRKKMTQKDIKKLFYEINFKKQVDECKIYQKSIVLYILDIGQ